MRFISTRTHGVLDYMTGLLLIVAPWLFGFADAGAAAWIPIVLGIGLLGVSLVTRYELSVAKMIPMPTHLALDVGLGIFLLISPWLFGFADVIWWPHVLVGILEIGAGLCTEKYPSAEALPDRV
jgi:hypothetical protein